MTLKSTIAATLLALLALLGLSPRAQAQEGDAPVVTVTAKASKTTVAPGDQVVIAILLDHAEGFHTWPNKPVVPAGSIFKAEDAIATTIIPAKDGVDPRLVVYEGFIQWPEARTVKTAGMMVPAYSGHAVAFLPVSVKADAQPGPARLDLVVTYQSCNARSCLPSEEVPLKIEFAVAATAPAAASNDPDFAGFDPSVWAAVQAAVAKPAAGGPPPAAGSKKQDGSADPTFDLFGLRFTSGSIFLILLIAALGGFVLNLTPCVLPVVPLKVMALQNSAGQHGSRRIALGISMFLGVIAFWFGLGLLIVSVKVLRATNELFGNPYFLLAVGTFIVVMALGMLGAFTIQLPQKLYMLNPSHDSLHGSFGFGVMTAVLGTPCFGPFAGAAAGWATTQPALVGLTTFAAIGLGMGIPYLVLAIWPGLLGFVPRTGPASELVKQIMGLLLFAAGVFFLGSGLLSLVAERPYLATVLHWWFVAAFTGMAGAWLVVRTIQITKSAGKRATFGLLGVVLAAAGVLWAGKMTAIAKLTYVPVTAKADALWKPFNAADFDAASKAGKVVVIDFTADWCINCKVLEAAVLEREEVKKALGGPGVVAFKADLTSRTAPGWAKIAEFHEVGIPLLVILGPGLDRPWKSNAYNPGQVIAALSEARSKPVASAPPSAPAR